MNERVALVWRDDPGSTFEASGLPPVGRALQARGVKAVDVPFSEEAVEECRRQLLSVDAALVWVDPISTRNGRNRSVLDDVLREVAAQGVWVSAHPDAILKLGTKDILVKTRGMAWGSDCQLYTSIEELARGLPERLGAGPLVLKQYRGNGGDGVWKVEALDPGRVSASAMSVRVLHARRGSATEEMPLQEFITRCTPYFDDGGCMIEQPFQERLEDGQIRCYVVDGRVSGFGHHFVAGLVDPGPGKPAPRNPRMYYGPSFAKFQPLKRRLEGGWIAEMLKILGMESDDLPILWDADFFYGPKDASGNDTFVLCEINVSSVDIFPGETLAALADAVARRLKRAAAD
jgi:hypothetical protein